MNRLSEIIRRRAARFGLLLLMAIAALLPNSAWARRDIAVAGRDPGRRVGDPLDTNDAGGNDGGSRDFNNPNGDPSNIVVFDSDAWTSEVLLVSSYAGGQVAFRMIRLAIVPEVLEASDAK